MTIRSARRAVAGVLRAAPWRPEHARLLLGQLRGRRARRAAPLARHLRAAADWLALAQDVHADGGVAGRYRLSGGWTASYPETTGYIVPTWLALAERADASDARERAGRCIEFLLPLQLESGAFPAGEIDRNVTDPSVFNTAQILCGLNAWHRATGAPEVRDAALRAADWLVATQDSDGAWRRHTYGGAASAYYAHASCWLAEFGIVVGESRYVAAAGRHIDWVLSRRIEETGWIELSGFPSHHAARIAVTHTLGYTLWGLLHGSELLGRADGVEAAAAAGAALASVVLEEGWIPGEVDWRWRPRAAYACLTGNAQLAQVWLRLSDQGADDELMRAARLALDGVAAAQPLSAMPALRGAIPGSRPVWGVYLQNACPNWSAKFFIDAVLDLERIEGGD